MYQTTPSHIRISIHKLEFQLPDIDDSMFIFKKISICPVTLLTYAQVMRERRPRQRKNFPI